MRFDIGIPSGAIKHYETWVGDGALADFAVAAEAAGFDSIHVTDHPFPDDAWLSNGGHQAFDPFVALATMAAVTDTIRLRTNLLVAGYRHPYLMARSIASLDRLSRGRTIVGMGAGYLRSEFEVLGADYERRGPVFDETIAAMTAAWSGTTVERGGPFAAHGHTMLPTPVQRPRPPIWVGGNSRAAKRRAATLGDGWIPMRANPTMASITGTSPLEDLDQLATGIADVLALREAAGETGPFEIAASGFGAPGEGDVEAWPEIVARHADVGATWMSLPCRGRSLTACLDEIAWLGEHVIAATRPSGAVTGAGSR